MALVGVQTLYACVSMPTRDEHVQGLTVVAHDTDDDAEGLADLGGHIADVTYLPIVVPFETVFNIRRKVGFPFHGGEFVENSLYRMITWFWPRLRVSIHVMTGVNKVLRWRRENMFCTDEYGFVPETSPKQED